MESSVMGLISGVLFMAGGVSYQHSVFAAIFCIVAGGLVFIKSTSEETEMRKKARQNANQ